MNSVSLQLTLMVVAFHLCLLLQSLFKKWLDHVQALLSNRPTLPAHTTNVLSSPARLLAALLQLADGWRTDVSYQKERATEPKCKMESTAWLSKKFGTLMPETILANCLTCSEWIRQQRHSKYKVSHSFWMFIRLNKNQLNLIFSSARHRKRCSKQCPSRRRHGPS